MLIAVDVAGGDNYPESPVEGALLALEADDSLEVLLVGPQELTTKTLDGFDYDDSRVHLQHAPEIVGMNESPAQAIKNKRNSSIAVGLSLHKKQQCQAFVSAGNTGALLAASTVILGKLEGVHRPAVAAIYPTLKGNRLLIDAGANLDMRTDMYTQFAQMGAVYVKTIMGVKNPSIGLLNVGDEEGKGTEELKEAYHELNKLPNFAGNIEGNDILSAQADVFLSNGLAGNLLLKLGESFPHALEKLIGKTAKEMHLSAEEMKLITTVLKKSLHAFDPDNVGGVPFLGVDGVSLVGHGSSTAKANKNMILNAAACVKNNINQEIVTSLTS